MKVFVIMPFQEEFDDVYMVIKDACGDPIFGKSIDCMRADEISKPGRITDQIIQAIKQADAVVADLTTSNPNVMYELGYAHALGKPAILMNQDSPSESPFDIKTSRQIYYDRKRLVKDCRPRLVQSIREVHAPESTPDTVEQTLPDEDYTEESESDTVSVDSQLAADVQAIHLRLQIANQTGDSTKLEGCATELLGLMDRISVFEGVDRGDLRNFMAAAGNCAVELEKGSRFQAAEDVFKRAISFMPDYPGTHVQYADFLVDRGRVKEATSELMRVKELDPADRRLGQVELKIALRQRSTTNQMLSSEMESGLREAFEQDKSNKFAAAAYLMALSGADRLDDFRRVCAEWETALPDDEKASARRALADQLAELSQYEEAIVLYEELLPHTSGEERAQVLHNLATCCRHQSQTDKAIRYWQESYALVPSRPEIRSSFSQALASTGDFDLALKVINGEPFTGPSSSGTPMPREGDIESEPISEPIGRHAATPEQEEPVIKPKTRTTRTKAGGSSKKPPRQKAQKATRGAKQTIPHKKKTKKKAD